LDASSDIKVKAIYLIVYKLAQYIFSVNIYRLFSITQ